MKIDKSGKTLPAAIAGDKSTRAGSGKAAPTNPSPQADSTSVSLGARATQLQSMESSMASTPVADPHKIAEIKLAISQGQFQVNSGVVADKLLQTVHTLIGSKG